MVTELRERLGSELDRLSRELAGSLAPERDGGLARLEEGMPRNGAQREVQTRIRRLGQLVTGLAKLDPAALFLDRAGFGSSVVLQDLATKERVTYTLMTAETIDLDEDQVTLASPIGQALLGRGVGERVTVETPQGTRRFRVVSLVSLPQMVGLAGS